MSQKSDILRQFENLAHLIKFKEEELASLKETYKAMETVIDYLYPNDLVPYSDLKSRNVETYKIKDKPTFRHWVADYLKNRNMAVSANDLRAAYNLAFSAAITQKSFAAKLSNLKKTGIITMVADIPGASDKYLWALPEWLEGSRLKREHILGF